MLQAFIFDTFITYNWLHIRPDTKHGVEVLIEEIVGRGDIHMNFKVHVHRYRSDLSSRGARELMWHVCLRLSLPTMAFDHRDSILNCESKVGTPPYFGATTL